MSMKKGFFIKKNHEYLVLKVLVLIIIGTTLFWFCCCFSCGGWAPIFGLGLAGGLLKNEENLYGYIIKS